MLSIFTQNHGSCFKAFTQRYVREIIVRHSNSSHISIKESTLVKDLKPHERYQFHAQMDHNHILTFEINLHRSRTTHFKDQEGLSKVVMGPRLMV